MKRMAEALSSATGVSARAAAITDSPFSDGAAEERKGKQPLVVLNVTPQAKRIEDVIDVKVTDV